MTFTTRIQIAAVAGVLALGALTGCKSAEDKALDQAKAQAASTNTPQQIQYIDGNGDTVTTTVQPPVAGQSQQVTTQTTPPAPGPKPAKTNPVITPVSTPTAMTPNPPPDPNAAMTAGAPSDQNAAMTPGAPTSDQPAQQPAPMSLTVRAGTELAIRINQNISVKHSRPGDRFSGEVVGDVTSNGSIAIPRGTHVSGRVDEAHRRGHFKGASILELRLVSMNLNGKEYALDTHDNVHTKRGKGRRSTGFIAGMTGAGMLIGGVATGGVGLAIGGAAGAGAGTLLAGATGNRDIDIPAESVQHFRLSDDLVVQN